MFDFQLCFEAAIEFSALHPTVYPLVGLLTTLCPQGRPIVMTGIHLFK